MRTENGFESAVDRQIREAAERGEFDDLPGSGKPITDLDATYDPAWWAKRYVRRERARDRADELRRVIRAELPRLRAAADRGAAEVRVGEINEMILAANEHLSLDDLVSPIRL